MIVGEQTHVRNILMGEWTLCEGGRKDLLPLSMQSNLDYELLDNGHHVIVIM